MNTQPIQPNDNLNPVPGVGKHSAGDRFTDIPETLKATTNFVGWRRQTVEGKVTKVPYNLHSGYKAATNNPSDWTGFETAVAAVLANPATAEVDAPSGYNGLGVVLHGIQRDKKNLIGLDFDNVLHGDVLDPYVASILAIAGNPYCEITPSGNGIRAFIFADGLPKDENSKPIGGRKFKAPNDAAEIYSADEPGRYLTLTGDRFLGSEIPVVHDIDLIHKLMSQMNNPKFRKLWTGDTSAYNNDQSAADMALLCQLATHTNGDAEKMEEYFNQSVFGEREKWTDREDYRDRSIENAIKWCKTAAPLEFKYPAVVGGHKDVVVEKLNDGTEGWFARGDVHLVAGPSGANKSTLMIALLEAQLRRERFLGHETFGLPYLIIMPDRGENAHKRTAERMRFDADKIPTEFVASLVDGAAVASIQQKIEECLEKRGYMPAVVFVEGCDMLTSNANKMEVITPFLDGLQRIARHYHISLIGSVGAPKARPGEGYISKRDSVFGTVVWSRKTETIIVLQCFKGDDMDIRRTLSVMLRNGAAEGYSMELKNGRLVEMDKTTAVQEDADIAWAKKQTDWWTIDDMAKGLNISYPTVISLV